MRLINATGLLALALWVPAQVVAQQPAVPAGEASTDTVPVQSVDANAALQANLLREQAISVLDRRGPADLALAQLTRAALLDPREAETWQALERGSDQIMSEPADVRERISAAGSAVAVRLQGLGEQLAGHMVTLRTTGLDFWMNHRANPRSWAGFLFLSLLSGSLLWGIRFRAQRRVARSLKAVATSTPVPTAPETQPRNPAITLSADELALKTYLENREGHSGGTAETGILARA